ncbi:MAG: hypothetical protein M0R02_05935 [Bacteroidales bacterium]|nr:hypothetical protein [Bacteroidales bacterium]
MLREDKKYRILLNITNIIEARNKIEKWNNEDLKRILLIKINILLDNKAYFRLLYTCKKYDFYNPLFLDIVKKTEMLVSQKIKNLNKSIAIWVGVLIILSIFKIRTYYYYMFSVAVLFFLITNIKIIRDTIYTPIIGFYENNKIK